MFFNSDEKIQEWIAIISNEGGDNALVKACDFYHFDFENKRAAMEWGLTFGEYIGRFNCSNKIWQFAVCDKGNIPYLFIYFLGEKDKVSERVFSVL